jgi:hypothetical protein
VRFQQTHKIWSFVRPARLWRRRFSAPRCPTRHLPNHVFSPTLENSDIGGKTPPKHDGLVAFICWNVLFNPRTSRRFPSSSRIKMDWQSPHLPSVHLRIPSPRRSVYTTASTRTRSPFDGYDHPVGTIHPPRNQETELLPSLSTSGYSCGYIKTKWTGTWPVLPARCTIAI